MLKLRRYSNIGFQIAPIIPYHGNSTVNQMIAYAACGYHNVGLIEVGKLLNQI